MHGSSQTSSLVLPADAGDSFVAHADAVVAEFIAGRINFERLPTDRYELEDFKLERMRSLLNRLGNPQHGIPAVHIAGTKGKGSTAAMTAAMLSASGRRVGLFTSPHIEHFSERMTINGTGPSAQEQLELVEQLRPVVHCMDTEGPGLRATFFEVLTAMAWMHFQRRAVDLVVLETGLGGRLDATNVCEPAVCLITTISYDHQRLLGNTLAAIAGEKAGIIKPGVPVISGVLNPEPREVIQRTAHQRQSPLYELKDSIRFCKTELPIASVSATDRLRLATIDVTTPWRHHSALEVPLAGDHQAHNLAMAVAAVDLLNGQGIDVSGTAVSSGLRNVHWPLRLEVVNDRPLVIVDAAHNVASVEALLDALVGATANRRRLVFSTSKDKDAAGMLSRLNGRFDEIVLTQFINNPRAVPLEQLESIARDVLSTTWTTATTPAEAWQHVLAASDADDLICASGSFFLAAEFRTVVRRTMSSHAPGAPILETSVAATCEDGGRMSG